MAEREYNSEYYQKNKGEIESIRRSRMRLEKISKMKEELSKIEFELINPYVEKVKNLKSYIKKMKKKFFLEYDIAHFYSRVRGDSKEYCKKRLDAFKEYWREWDLKNRIVRWRYFRKAILIRTNSEPTASQCQVNNIFCPKEIIKDNEDYRVDLIYLAQIQADDPIFRVSIASDWAKEDEKKYQKEKKKKYKEEDYKKLLCDEGLL